MSEDECAVLCKYCTDVALVNCPVLMPTLSGVKWYLTNRKLLYSAKNVVCGEELCVKRKKENKSGFERLKEIKEVTWKTFCHILVTEARTKVHLSSREEDVDSASQ